MKWIARAPLTFPPALLAGTPVTDVVMIDFNPIVAKSEYLRVVLMTNRLYKV